MYTLLTSKVNHRVLFGTKTKCLMLLSQLFVHSKTDGEKRIHFQLLLGSFEEILRNH